jgi:hypothetical protein
VADNQSLYQPVGYRCNQLHSVHLGTAVGALARVQSGAELLAVVDLRDFVVEQGGALGLLPHLLEVQVRPQELEEQLAESLSRRHDLHEMSSEMEAGGSQLVIVLQPARWSAFDTQQKLLQLPVANQLLLPFSTRSHHQSIWIGDLATKSLSAKEVELEQLKCLVRAVQLLHRCSVAFVGCSGHGYPPLVLDFHH